MINIITTKHRRIRKAYWVGATAVTLFLALSSVMAQMAGVDQRLVTSLYLMTVMPSMMVIGYLTGYMATLSRRVQGILLGVSIVAGLATLVLMFNFSNLVFPAYGLMLALGVGSLAYAAVELIRTRRWSSNQTWLVIIGVGGIGIWAVAMGGQLGTAWLPVYVVPFLVSISGIGFVLGQRVAGYAALLRQAKRRTNKKNRRRGRRR